MNQVTFSEQSLEELNKLKIQEQMRVVEQISNLTTEQLADPQEPLGRFTRDGKPFYRLRIGHFRCYFEVRKDELYSHYFLHQNTLKDFVFRNKFPFHEIKDIGAEKSEEVITENK